MSSPRRLLALAVLTGILVTPWAVARPGGAQPSAEASSCVPTDAVTRNLAYGPARLQKVDVYPARAAGCGENPVVVWVHGGGWRTGDKGRLNAKRAWARRHGWTLVSVNYRLSDPEVPAGRRIRYPTHNRDVGRAVGWVHDHIARYGGDPARIALIGHSAGAQIVSSVGVDEDYLRRAVREDVCGVISLDTAGYDVAARIRDDVAGSRLYRNAFGNVPAVWRDASPINHLDAGDAPQLVVRRGSRYQQRAQVRYALAARAAGISITVVPTLRYSHTQVNRLLGAPGDTSLTPRVEAFLDDCFAG